MDQTVLPGQNFHKRAVRHDADDPPGVDISPLDAQFLGETENALYRRVGSGRLGRCNRDGSVILDVDLGAGLVLDRSNHLAARPNDGANLLWIDLQANDA